MLLLHDIKELLVIYIFFIVITIEESMLYFVFSFTYYNNLMLLGQM